MTVEEIEEAVVKLRPEDLARFRAWFQELDFTQIDGDGFYEASDEELRGIDRGLRESAEGKFASAAEMAETFAKFRTP